MITKPKDAVPRYARIEAPDGFGTEGVMCFTAAECSQIAKAYVLATIDAMQGAYGADRERDEWYDMLNDWEGTGK